MVITQRKLRKLSTQDLQDLPIHELCKCVDVAFYGEKMQGTDRPTLERVMKVLNWAVQGSSF